MSRALDSPLPDRGSSGGFVGLIIALVFAGLLLLAGIVAVVVLIRFRAMQSDSSIEAARTQVQMLEDAVRIYQLQTGSLPPDLYALIRPPANPAVAAKWNGPFVQTLSSDPWGHRFEYEMVGPEKFRLWSSGPDGVTPSPDDVHSSR